VKLKPGSTVLVYDVSGKVPRVFLDEDEASHSGVNPGACEKVALDVAMERGVRKHHDWAPEARKLARLRVVQETGRPMPRFQVDVAPSVSPEKLPRSVRVPEEWGGGDRAVTGSHGGLCACEERHAARWLDVEGGLMVTRCPIQGKFLWVDRGGKLDGG